VKRIFFILILCSACSGQPAFKGLPSLNSPAEEAEEVHPEDLPPEVRTSVIGLPRSLSELSDLSGRSDLSDRSDLTTGQDRPADFGRIKLRIIPYDPCKTKVCPREREETEEDRRRASVPYRR